MKNILVVGSLNMDCVVETPHIPQAGETVSGRNVSFIPGGKGANQAYTAGKLGGSVKMLGAVGNDSFGQTLKANLADAGVDVSGIYALEKETTGQAFISIDDTGENSIIVIPGANGAFTPDLIEKKETSLAKMIEKTDIVVMQLEIPLETVLYVKELAASLQKLIIVDPAPALSNIPDCFWEGIDYIKPNETELSILTGKQMKTQEEMIDGANLMLEKGVRNVIVTMGGKGCMLVNSGLQQFFPARRVKAVDTTAAGDCFTAAFALALAEGKSCSEAIVFGQTASAIAVTRKGAQTSIPTREEVESASP